MHDASMKTPDGPEIVSAANRDVWRAWLSAHHGSERGVWLVMQKKGSAEPGVSYEEAVEEALSFGWIDSRAHRRDDASYLQLFSPRRPKSTWAATNKARVDKLIAEGRMTPAGLALVDAAKADGSWDALEAVEKAGRNERAAHWKPPAPHEEASS